jgi:NarL family two-component system response regulator LiaR
MLQEIAAVRDYPLGTDCCPDLSLLAGQELTHREYQVWSLMEAGWSDAQIADLLFLNPLTVRFHLTNAVAKLDAAARREATVTA